VTVVDGCEKETSGGETMKWPSAVTVDSDGNIYVADEFNHRIQKYGADPNSGITIVGGNGAGSKPNQLIYPSSFALDASGNIYVADRFNNRLQKFDVVPCVTAVAVLSSDNGSQVHGEIQITQKQSGSPLIIEGTIYNLKRKSQHGLHVHESGDLSNGCVSAGEHFNPRNVNHGSENSTVRHPGDLGNVRTDAEGVGRIHLVIHDAELFGHEGWIGRSIVVHAKMDDLGLSDNEGSRSTGNSGDRLACGIVGIKNPTGRLPDEKTPPSHN
ncbi:unnamed protein product, partial [Didymodactylos carnosus]